MNDDPQVAVTGTSWMGSGIGSIESSLTYLFKKARDEISLTVYTIGSGADLVFNLLRIALDRGILVRLVINRLEKQPIDVRNRLLSLTSDYSHFHLYDFQDTSDAALHAKAVVVDHRIALIGSSNMSKRGLLANHELAVIVSGSAAVTAGKAMDCLFSSPLVKQVRVTEEKAEKLK